MKEYIVYRTPHGEILVDWNETTWKYGYPSSPKSECKELERGMSEGGKELPKLSTLMRLKYQSERI